MDKDTPGLMTPFDELVTTPELQMIKLLIPYAPASGRQTLAGMVKFMELRETLHLFRRRNGGLQAQMIPEDGPHSPVDILNSFRPYLKPREASMLDMIINIREMMSVMEMMQASQENAEGNGSSFNPMELLTGILPPEQQEMFRMYSDMFSQAPDSAEKGDEYDGQRMDEQSGNEEYRSGEAGTDPDGI
ncbi:hypothetical protein [Mediterraneibacter glycyrrhizinilyticus]|uniref:hypothetical protein n=1 Tax=Mediterraneibacter glycyrrhizinilyticus TaxID=342942 RepID=UPI0025A39F81|nr:hypothetical protein [Mediterraneibacter glycyrrhizinilyticus]MDM8210057.1 hypothetical protein [Mediterraneibacter glycyrrhizinilyticus]